MRPELSVGIMTADWADMGSELRKLEAGGADHVHIDVMDGSFSPQITVGPPVIRSLETPLGKDVHLMIDEPLDSVAAYVAAGADMVTIHVESTRHPHRVLQVLGSQESRKGRPLKRGVALNPGTPVSALEPLLELTDLVLVLAVNPGWGGQRFQPATERRLHDVRELALRTGREVVIGVDGGITRENVAAVARMGPDLIVTGSAVFDGGDALANLRAMAAEIDGVAVT